MKIYIARDADSRVYGFKNYPVWDGRAWHSIGGWCKEFPAEEFPDIKTGECRLASIQSIPVGKQEVVSPAPDTKRDVLDKFINNALSWFEFDIATSEGGLKELKEWEREEFRNFMTQRMKAGEGRK